jgi:ABC-type bacteriocin/lantibiotic exporter with double-glycine peptidase domain
MSFLVSQSEVNDCGVAICTMVLKHFAIRTSLERVKIDHCYQHEQYSFAKIGDVLARHQIISTAFEFNNLQSLTEEPGLFCFQIYNDEGLLHFVIAKPLKKLRWIIYDPAKSKPLILSTNAFQQSITGKVQRYEQSSKTIVETSLKKKILITLLKTNFKSFLLVNSLMFINFFFSILGNSFLRIIFQEYQ